MPHLNPFSLSSEPGPLLSLSLWPHPKAAGAESCPSIWTWIRSHKALPERKTWGAGSQLGVYPGCWGAGGLCQSRRPALADIKATYQDREDGYR